VNENSELCDFEVSDNKFVLVQNKSSLKPNCHTRHK